MSQGRAYLFRYDHPVKRRLKDFTITNPKKVGLKILQKIVASI